MRKIQFISTCSILVISIIFIAYTLQNNNSKSADNAPILSNEIVTTQPSNDINLIDLTSSNNISVNFAEKPTVILFFTSWCPYCNEDAPKIVQLHKKYKSDINLFGINLVYRDDLQEVREYVKNYDIEYPILLDESGSVYKKYGGSGFPSLYFFNSKGEIIDQLVGSTDIENIENSFKYLQDNFSV
ncbi:TlpA family protein disulfide reductase [Cohnella sp.]|uniref:TlpA family protein disulfide reductase n=1 Tax=Cohnella sp. TaxID=1883426 RepID=UPI003567CC00